MIVIKVSLILLHCLGFIYAAEDYDYNKPKNPLDYTNGNEFIDVNKLSESDNTGYDYPTPKELEFQYYPTNHYSPNKYNYNYAVHDPKTGDIKSHSESTDGYSVRGSYSLVDPDGFKRIVTYTADDLHGFNAVVRRVPYVFQSTSKPLPVVESSTPITLVLNLKDVNGKNIAESPSQKMSQSPKTVESTTPEILLQSLDSYASQSPLENDVENAPYV